MSYEVGTHIDLRYLNRKSESEVVQAAPKKSNVQEAASTLYEVGTQFVFNLKAGQEAKAARRIRVVYA